MNLIKFILMGLLLFNIIGCSTESSNEVASSSLHKETDIEAKQRQRAPYLAYEHKVSVELSKNEITPVFERILQYCAADQKNKCTILHSSLNTGDYSSSSIQARILPNGVGAFLDVVAKDGDISNKSTDIEDLQDVIVNGNKRLEMLKQYQNRLMQLEKASPKDVESLIKIAKALSQVQSDIEYAEGEKARLRQRTQMDIVYISLHARSYISFWAPISESIADFGENLSGGISQAITIVAYLLPWVIILIFLLYILRFFWRKTKAK